MSLKSYRVSAAAPSPSSCLSGSGSSFDGQVGGGGVAGQHGILERVERERDHRNSRTRALVIHNALHLFQEARTCTICSRIERRRRMRTFSSVIKRRAVQEMENGAGEPPNY